MLPDEDLCNSGMKSVLTFDSGAEGVTVVRKGCIRRVGGLGGGSNCLARHLLCPNCALCPLLCCDLQKQCEEGIDFCKRKIGMLKLNMENLLKLVKEKQEVQSQVHKVLQAKLAAAQAQPAQSE